MLHARRPDEHRVPILALEQAVVRDPAERDLGEREAVLLRDGLDLGECVEVRRVPVPLAVRLARVRVRVEAGAGVRGGVRVEAGAGVRGGVRVLERAVAAGEEAPTDCQLYGSSRRYRGGA